MLAAMAETLAPHVLQRLCEALRSLDAETVGAAEEVIPFVRLSPRRVS